MDRAQQSSLSWPPRMPTGCLCISRGCWGDPCLALGSAAPGGFGGGAGRDLQMFWGTWASVDFAYLAGSESSTPVPAEAIWGWGPSHCLAHTPSACCVVGGTWRGDPPPPPQPAQDWGLTVLLGPADLAAPPFMHCSLGGLDFKGGEPALAQLTDMPGGHAGTPPFLELVITLDLSAHAGPGPYLVPAH